MRRTRREVAFPPPRLCRRTEEKNSFVIYVIASSISSSSSSPFSGIPPPFGDSHRSPANFKLLIHIWSRLLLFSFFPLSARPRVRPWASSREKGSGGGERGRPPYEVFSPCLLWRERTTSPSTQGDLDRMKDFLKTGKTAARGGGRRARGRKIPTEREEGKEVATRLDSDSIYIGCGA